MISQSSLREVVETTCRNIKARQLDFYGKCFSDEDVEDIKNKAVEFLRANKGKNILDETVKYIKYKESRVFCLWLPRKHP